MNRWLPALILAAACAGRNPTDDTARGTGELSDCDPISPRFCGLPFPSTFFMREDDTSPTGWRIHLGETTLPQNYNGYQMSPTYWNERDGWSPLGTILADFPNVSLDGTISHKDISAYTAPDAKTVVIDVATGERAPIWVERDVSVAGADDYEGEDHRLLLIHPAAPLQYGHRYVVGIRGLTDTDGNLIPASDAFAALRDGTPTDDPDIELRRSLYDDTIFPTLEADGWSRDETQLAWDFVVGSREGITGKAVWMRDDLYERLGDSGPAYTIDSVEQAPRDHTAFRLHGTMTVPLYTEEDRGGTLLTRGPDGMPYYNGDTEVPFTVVVPNSVAENGGPAPIVQYGHGLLGDQSEVQTGYLAEMSDAYGWILIAVDWTGMKEDDRGPITEMLVNDPDAFSIIPERTQQGFVEFLAAMKLATGPLVDEPYLQWTDPDTGETHSMIDPTRRYYYGNSQGAVLGGAYLALSDQIDRAVLGVGGTPYCLLLNRSQDFEPFFHIFHSMFPDPADIAYLIAAYQTLWDSGEDAGYASLISDDPLEGSTPTTVLLQVAVGDHQVTTLGAHVLARALGAHLIDPPVRDVWGLETAESGAEGSALVEWDYGITEPDENTPPADDNDPHEWPRRETSGQEQINTFFQTGTVVNYCGGPCESTPPE